MLNNDVECEKILLGKGFSVRDYRMIASDLNLLENRKKLATFVKNRFEERLIAP